MDVMQNKCLRIICGLIRIGKVGNEEVRRRVSVRYIKSNRVKRMISKLFKHVDRMGDQRLTRSERRS